MNNDELSHMHKALSVPVRLRILELLSKQPRCVNAITRFLDISQPAVSQHLSLLKQVGLVKAEKRGYRVHYALNRSRLLKFHKAVTGFLEEESHRESGAEPNP
jgi:DNA-binding transcriptional ArsR family regulator